MNEMDIAAAVHRHRGHPVLARATKLLEQFKDIVNENSDGWPYWSPAPRAAKKLMELIQKPDTATEVAFKKALTPIKTFCTRHKLQPPVSLTP